MLFQGDLLAQPFLVSLPRVVAGALIQEDKPQIHNGEESPSAMVSVKQRYTLSIAGNEPARARPIHGGPPCPPLIVAALLTQHPSLLLAARAFPMSSHSITTDVESQIVTLLSRLGHSDASRRVV